MRADSNVQYLRNSLSGVPSKLFFFYFLGTAVHTRASAGLTRRDRSMSALASELGGVVGGGGGEPSAQQSRPPGQANGQANGPPGQANVLSASVDLFARRASANASELRVSYTGLARARSTTEDFVSPFPPEAVSLSYPPPLPPHWR